MKKIDGVEMQGSGDVVAIQSDSYAQDKGPDDSGLFHGDDEIGYFPWCPLTKAKWFGFFFGILLWLIFYLVELDEDLPLANDCAAVTAITAVWWVFEVWPLPVTSLLPLILFPFFLVGTGKSMAKTYFTHISFLFVGAFLVDIAIEKVHLHKRVALNILLVFGVNPKLLMLGFMVVAGLISMFCSNTSTTIMLLPVATSLLDGRTDGKNAAWYEKGLLLSVAYGATCGGLSTPIGTPPNGVFMNAIETEFPNFPGIDFASWMGFALPISICMILGTWTVLVIIYARDVEIKLEKATLRNELKALGPMRRDEIAVACCLGLQVFLWITRPFILSPYIGKCADSSFGDKYSCEAADKKWSGYVDDGTMACIAAFLLFVIPSKDRRNEMVMTEADIALLPWGLLILFGGGFCIAEGFKVSGLSEVVGKLLEKFIVFGPYGMVTMMTFVIVFLTELTSNTATASIIIPPILGLAYENKINPFLTALPITVGASLAYMFPVATPPNAVIFATGKIRFREMMKTGFFLNILGIIIVPIFIFSTANIFGNLNEYPEWAETLKAEKDGC